MIANRTKLAAADALALAKKSKRVISARGKQVVTFELKTDKPTDEMLLAILLGPTGNLRAPAAVVGDTLVVGFSPDLYGEVLGAKG